MALHNWAHVYREIISTILPVTPPSVFYSQSAPSHLFFHLWMVSVCKGSIVLQLSQLFLWEILVFLWDTTMAISVNSHQHYKFLCHVVYFLPESFLDLLTCFSPPFYIVSNMATLFILVSCLFKITVFAVQERHWFLTAHGASVDVLLTCRYTWQECLNFPNFFQVLG